MTWRSTDFTLKDLSTSLGSMDPEKCPLYLEAFRDDCRAGAKAMRARIRKKWRAWIRAYSTWDWEYPYERSLLGSTSGFLAGVDEVGRGPLAGPVVAACVILPPGYRIEAARDSKGLSATVREEIYRSVVGRCLDYGIGMVGPRRIDATNILEAALLAMRRAVEDLSVEPELVLVDGNQTIPDLRCRQEPEVRGDERLPSVGAASVIAKVTRDSLMARYGHRYPGYGLDRNKGYATSDHWEALQRMGPSPIHRLSFLGRLRSERQLDLPFTGEGLPSP